jgi:chromosomal replication initiation ATPase DnaA
MNAQALWSAVLAKVAGQVGQHSFETWFRPLACAGGDATSLRLLAPTEHFRRCLLDSFGDLMQQAAAEIRGAPCQLVITIPVPDSAPSADTLPVVQAAELEQAPVGGRNWLIENLWLAETVGFLGSPPKHCKTWLALEMAVSVASGSPCLGTFPVPDPGPVLLYAAEDPTTTVRQRLQSLAAHHHVDFDQLPLWVITVDSLRQWQLQKAYKPGSF